MSDGSFGEEKYPGAAALETAARAIDRWASTSAEYTGRWIDERDALVGVGVVDQADDEAIRELLKSTVPSSIRVRVRFVSAQWIRLRQLQVHVFHYLDDEGIWQRYGTALGVDRLEQHVELGLLPTAPDAMAAEILEKFPKDVVLNRNGSYAIAL